MTCGINVVIDRGEGFQVFLVSLSKCSSCLTYVLLITFQPITFVSINYATLFLCGLCLLVPPVYLLPFSSFLSLSCFSIIPDDIITSILVSLINLLSYLSFSNNWGSLLISSKSLSQGFLSSTFGILDKPPCYVWQCYV